MRPLTALKYFKENKRKAVVSFVVLIFTVCAISLITILINSLTATVNDVNLKPFEHFSAVFPVDGEDYLKDEVVTKLHSSNDVERFINCDLGFTSINLAIGGNTSVPVMFMSKSDNEYLLDKMSDKITEGTMPKDGTHEIAVHWRIMANKKWKVGDVVGSYKSETESLNGEYKIVGKIDGPSIVAIGAESYKQELKNKENSKEKPMAYLLIPKDGKRDEVNKLVDSIEKKQAQVFTYDKMKDFLDSVMSGLNSTIFAIILIVIFILSISVGSLMYVIYIQRSDEFGILYAMGYRRKFIRNLIIKEIMSLNLICWTAGLVFTYGVVWLLNKSVYNPKGDILNMFETNVLIYTLIIPLMVGLFSILPIAMRLRKWDPVAVIERRE